MEHFCIHESEQKNVISDFLKRKYWMAVAYVANDGSAVYVGFKVKS